MAVVQYRVVLAVGLFDLVQRLGNEEGFDAVACHEGKCAFEEVEAAQRRKFIEHQQQAVRTFSRGQLFGKPPPDLIEDEADQRLGPADVAGRYDQI